MADRLYTTHYMVSVVGVFAMSYKSRHISISINNSVDEVYAFASNPENLPKWAAGLSGSVKNVKGEWVAESPMGTIKIKFADKNRFGILDHDVTLPSGETIKIAAN